MEVFWQTVRCKALNNGWLDIDSLQEKRVDVECFLMKRKLNIRAAHMMENYVPI